MEITKHLPWLLVTLTIICTTIALADRLYFAKKRPRGEKQPIIAEYATSFFSILLLVLLLRSFLVQLYWVPTGSLIPTLDIDEMSLVTQYDYGLHAPIYNTTLLKTHTPKRGDIAVFHWPVNPRANLIKRVIGLPGDDISFNHGVLTINGIKASQQFVGITHESNGKDTWTTEIFTEDLLGVKHKIQVCHNQTHCAPNVNFSHLKVPPHQYFMMGDNRNNSDDSRAWGFVPEQNLIGKARFIVFSWNRETQKIRWDRIGNAI